jgi:hypothetical protein
MTVRLQKRQSSRKNAQENETSQASMSTDPTPTPITYSYNQANEYFQKNFIGNHLFMPVTCDRL